MERISIVDAKRVLSMVINKVAFTHEPIVVTSHGKPKAVLIGHEEFLQLKDEAAPKIVRLGGLWAGTPHVSGQRLRAARGTIWRRISRR